MKTKSKLMISALIFFLGSVPNLFFSAALDHLLSHRVAKLTFLSPGECFVNLVSSKQHLLLFLCIQGFFLVLAVLFFTTNLHPYRSDLEAITPDIRTPKAVGQYQHGSARWMTDEEKNRCFSSFVLDPYDKTIKALLDSGYEDVEFMKRKEDEKLEM